jgi:lipopolysaccharide export system permease protein
MKRLHLMTLRMLPGPILGWLSALMFLLLMQFLIKYLPDIAGKGLPIPVIVELVAYNLAYMLVLAVPMSVLIGTMMVFGGLAESRAYVVMKNAGISPIQLMWPTLVVGLLLTIGMTHFNNVVLPEANFRARNLWQDIRRKQPGFALQPGVFYNGVDRYRILVQQIPPGSNELLDVLIYDYTDGPQRQATIKAERGWLSTTGDGSKAILALETGEVHRLLNAPSAERKERYERVSFGRYRLQLDLSDFEFERSDPTQGYRSDRTMRTGHMVRIVDSLQVSIEASMRRMLERVARVGSMEKLESFSDIRSAAPVPRDTVARWDTLAPPRVALSGADAGLVPQLYETATNHVRTTRTEIDDARRGVHWEQQRAARYRVEIHKKYSIALACVIFVLIGAPLGLSMRRGGLGRMGALATAIFMFYWVTLVQGEKLADRGFLEPWVGMWAANVVMGALGLWLMIYVSLDLRATPPLRRRLYARSARRGPHLPKA